MHNQSAGNLNKALYQDFIGFCGFNIKPGCNSEAYFCTYKTLMAPEFTLNYIICNHISWKLGKKKNDLLYFSFFL